RRDDVAELQSRREAARVHVAGPTDSAALYHERGRHRTQASHADRPGKAELSHRARVVTKRRRNRLPTAERRFPDLDHSAQGQGDEAAHQRGRELSRSASELVATISDSIATPARRTT